MLKDRILSKKAKISVIGLGYTGLPLAIEFAKEHFETIGIDIDADRVDDIKTARSYLKDVDSAVIRALVRSGRLVATDDFDVITETDVVQICVPTPLTEAREPDMTFVIGAAKSVAARLKRQRLIILQSTTYPGTTEEVVKPILEAGGLVAGKDFYLGYSPERVDPGNKRYTIRNTPKIVGGYTPKCLELTRLLYEQIIEKVVPVSSLKAAEMTKLFENIFRNVNIALVNELTLLSERLGLNVWEIIDAAATKPFGFMKFYPGPGVGGHCIGVDPFYLSWKARQDHFYTEFIELAGKINENMPFFVVGRIADALNERHKSLRGSKILLLGAAYKKDISDIRESPALKLIKLLKKKGAEVLYHDPHVPVLPDFKMESQPLTRSLLGNIDCAVVVTDHSGVDYLLVNKTAPLIVDTRNVMKDLKKEKIIPI